jgi:hypothetical protein
VREAPAATHPELAAQVKVLQLHLQLKHDVVALRGLLLLLPKAEAAAEAKAAKEPGSAGGVGVEGWG